MLSKIATAVGLAATLLSGAYFAEDRYEAQKSHAADRGTLEVKTAQLDDKIELKIIQDDLSRTQERVWTLEDREDLNPEQKKSLKELRAKEIMLEGERGRILERMDSRTVIR